MQLGQVIIVQLISAIDAAVRFLYGCLSAAMSFSVIRCLPAVFHTLLHRLVVDPLQQSIHLLFGRPLDLFPVGYHWCTLLVSLLSFIRNTYPSHFNLICLILLDTGNCCVLCLIVSFVILSLYLIRIILMSQRLSQASSVW